MVLVDVSKKVEDPVSKAISSLVTSNEFSRVNYRSNAIAIAHLDKEMNEILDRTDLQPDEKLALYNLHLKRYLFLQREREKADNSTSVKEKQPKLTVNRIKANLTGPVTEDDDASISTIDEEDTVVANVPVTPKKLYEIKKPLFKNTLPRSTPKSEILRTSEQRRPPSRYPIDQFGGWATLGKKKK